MDFQIKQDILMEKENHRAGFDSEKWALHTRMEWKTLECPKVFLEADYIDRLFNAPGNHEDEEYA